MKRSEMKRSETELREVPVTAMTAEVAPPSGDAGVPGGGRCKRAGCAAPLPP